MQPEAGYKKGPEDLLNFQVLNISKNEIQIRKRMS